MGKKLKKNDVSLRELSKLCKKAGRCEDCALKRSVELSDIAFCSLILPKYAIKTLRKILDKEQANDKSILSNT